MPPAHNDSSSAKPVIIAGAFPASGHTLFVVQIARYLTSRGFIVYFIAGAQFETVVKDAGCHYIRNEYRFESAEILKNVTSGLSHENPQGGHHYLDGIEPAYSLLVKTMELVRIGHPDRRVIIFQETLFGGTLPFFYGTPLPTGYKRRPPILAIHCTINPMTSVDVPPYGPGLPLATDEETVAKYRAIETNMFAMKDLINNQANRILKSLGATQTMTGWYRDIWIASPDITMFMFHESQDYPRSDLSPNIRFIGALPLQTHDSTPTPSWWLEIEANALSREKKVVCVTQGTMQSNLNALLLPTIKALSSRDDLIVVGILGGRDVSPPSETPANTRIVAYMSYDTILPYTDVFVSNAGFGGFRQSLMNGVPMVLAGVETDKGEVCARAEWSGVAVNLRTSEPSTQALAEAVDTVLQDGSFKRRVLELKKMNEEMNAMGKVEELIRQLAE